MPPVVESRPTWSSNFRLYLAMFSYSTGITIPKFASPWLLKTNVGILLLIPVQLLVMFLTTIPCMFMELALGQYSNRAVIRVWDLCPLLRGIGLCSFLTFLLYQSYYNFLCTCSLCFTFLSFTSEPQWRSCNRSWNKINCFTLRDNYTKRLECSQRYGREKCDKMQWQSSVEQFYFNRVLNTDETSGYVGAPQPELLVYGLVTIILIFFANYGGPKTTEKFLLVLATVPTVQMVVLFFAPLSDQNGFVTLNYLFTQLDVKNLSNFKTWTRIINLSLSSPGLGFGAFIAFGTQSTFRTPLHFKAIIISVTSVLFTVLYSIIVQNFLISLCIQSQMLFDDFFKLEQELEMPEAVFFLEHSSRFWITMWLSNCYMTGLRSLIVMMCLNTEVVYNSLPKARKRHTLCVLTFSLIIYTGTIFLSTRIGYSVFKTIESVLNDFCVPFLNTLQLVGVVYFYGITKFRDDVHFMLGIRSSVYWNTLYVLNPLLLGIVLAYNLHDFFTGGSFNFHSLGIFRISLIWFSLVVVTLYAFFYIIVSFFGHHFKVCKSSPEWGPRHGSLFVSRKMFKAYNVAKEYLYRQERFSQQ
ncbi:sodium-dependent noradrenaline transporter [Tribolium castaneum]|uniref:Sodium-and chloride-dependent GABA transporter ine-like Protein n=1 Tax=Tribolium castaneum TaxID=7070 RepID=D6WVZ1_TRICA|nr:PREDICTED: sodium-dependent noradrenaline transporter [Tribolium castaneum]EFA08215.1 Sodium- and chloride-dependent GABA transporter ine-like Protein [Tribolium castaneum]|eukprot:XP_008196672.1 PREDICTED: sodium-dependent noradrenaline transporter [Tribolium castaneum]